MRPHDYRPKKGEPKLGTFVYSSADCGDEGAIRIAFLEWCEKTEVFEFSPDDAEKFAEIILEVVKDYRNGTETNYKA
jgi:hypothetical protein